MKRLSAHYLVLADAEREVSKVLPVNVELRDILARWIVRHVARSREIRNGPRCERCIETLEALATPRWIVEALGSRIHAVGANRERRP